MKNLIILILLTLSNISLAGERTTYRSPTGHYRGSGYTANGNTSYRNSRGQYVGSANTRGNRTGFYGPQGHNRGSAYGPFYPAKYFPKSK
jgi:hypothetical protein